MTYGFGVLGRIRLYNEVLSIHIKEEEMWHERTALILGIVKNE